MSYLDTEAEADRRQVHIDAMRTLKMDELHSDVAALARAVDDWTLGQSPAALADLLAALTKTERNATAGDNMILRYDAAMTVIDKLVKEVVDAMERKGVFDE